MVDRNGNGIPDELERGSVKNFKKGNTLRRPPREPLSDPAGYLGSDKRNTYRPSESLTGWGGEFVNFLTRFI